MALYLAESTGTPDVTETTTAVSNYRWLVVGLWMVASVSGFMVLSTVGILLPSISADLHLSPSKQGLLGSAAFWGNITLALPMTWWTSRFGPRALTAVTLTLSTAALFLQGWAPAFAILLLGRLAFGITIIARQPARVALTQQWFAAREFVLVNSMSNVLFGLVVGGGLLTAPLILAAFGDSWRATLNTFAGLFAVLTILWIILGRERRTADARPQEWVRDLSVIRGALGFRDLWIVGLGFLGANFAWSAFLSFYPSLMLDRYGLALTWSGAILAVGVLVGGGVGLGFGLMVMKMGNTNALLKILGVLMAATYVAMTLIGNIPVLMALTVLNGIAWGFWPLLFTIPFHLPNIRPREVAVAVAFTMMMTSCGGALGPLAAGFLQEALGDLRLTLAIISFTSLLLTAAGFLLRTSRQPQTDGRKRRTRPQPLAPFRTGSGPEGYRGWVTVSMSANRPSFLTTSMPRFNAAAMSPGSRIGPSPYRLKLLARVAKSVTGP